MMTINFDTITNNYEVIYVIKTVMKFHLKKIDTSFHQPLPNMVQRLFADVINDAIWFMNIHEQNHPWFLAMAFNNEHNSYPIMSAKGPKPTVERYSLPLSIGATSEHLCLFDVLKIRNIWYDL